MKIIDFHTHILPKADHGSTSFEITKKQLIMAKKSNVEIAVATPHFYPHKHNIDKFISKRDASFKRLYDSEFYATCGVRVIPAAEVLICPALDKLQRLEELCIKGTKTLLIELPYKDADIINVLPTMKSLIKKGFSIILAHADRYTPKIVDKAINIGAELQINTSALFVMLGKSHILKWIQDNHVVALGSDIHMKNKFSYFMFNRAKKKLGEDTFNKIMSLSENIISEVKNDCC